MLFGCLPACLPTKVKSRQMKENMSINTPCLSAIFKKTWSWSTCYSHCKLYYFALSCRVVLSCLVLSCHVLLLVKLVLCEKENKGCSWWVYWNSPAMTCFSGMTLGHFWAAGWSNVSLALRSTPHGRITKVPCFAQLSPHRTGDPTTQHGRSLALNEEDSRCFRWNGAMKW